MILSPEERRQALDGAIELLTREGFELTHVSLDAVSREIPSDVEGQKKFHDTGVRIVSVIGLVDPRPDEYGAEVSESADGPNDAERLRHAEEIITDAQALITDSLLPPSLDPIARGNALARRSHAAQLLLEEIWRFDASRG